MAQQSLALRIGGLLGIIGANSRLRRVQVDDVFFSKSLLPEIKSQGVAPSPPQSPEKPPGHLARNPPADALRYSPSQHGLKIA